MRVTMDASDEVFVPGCGAQIQRVMQLCMGAAAGAALLRARICGSLPSLFGDLDRAPGKCYFSSINHPRLGAPMYPARAAALALLLTACGAPAAVALHTGAVDSDLAEPLHTGSTDGASAEAQPVAFAATRPVDRAADPLRPAPEGAATVRLGLPVTDVSEGPGVLWGRDPAAVLAELEYNAGHLQRCWEGRSTVARPGTIVIHAHLDPSGQVGGQCVSDDGVGDPDLLRCANDLISMGRYPALEEGAEGVVFTFHFEGGQG